MNTSIVLNKLGNHWYPAVNHNDVQELVLDPKFEKYLSLIDTNKTGCLIINFSQCHEFIENALFFKDEDINRYFITNDSFDLTCFILNHQFSLFLKLYFFNFAIFRFFYYLFLFAYLYPLIVFSWLI